MQVLPVLIYFWLELSRTNTLMRSLPNGEAQIEQLDTTAAECLRCCKNLGRTNTFAKDASVTRVAKEGQPTTEEIDLAIGDAKMTLTSSSVAYSNGKGVRRSLGK